eukprot:gene376-474_t
MTSLSTTATSTSNSTGGDDKDVKKQTYFHEISDKLQTLSEMNDKLKEKNLYLLQQQDSSESKIESFRQELDSKSAQILMLENKLKEMKNKYFAKEEENKKLRFLNEELLEWKETHKITEEDYLRVKEAIRIKDDNIGSLSIQLEHSINRNAMLSESLKEISERGSIFERDESFNISSASKQLLDYQKMMAFHKIKSVEEKYSTIKNINLGLQKSIQELALENEKYKYTLEAILKNSNVVVNLSFGQANCPSIGDCITCASTTGCSWCSNNNTGCVASTPTSNCIGCMLNDAHQCPITGAASCSEFTNCRDCNANPRCGFCTSSMTCMSVDGNGYLCNGQATCPGCVTTSVDFCPEGNSKCSDYTNCRSCSSQPRCNWCTSSNSCLNVNGNGYLCAPQTCQGCTVGTVKNCPVESTSCSDHKTPRSCASQPRCGWCSSSNTCQNADGNGYICKPETCQGCLNTNPFNSPAGDTFCSNYTDCRTCSEQPRCGWCTSSNSCLDVDGNGYLCAPGQCMGCVRTSSENCPASTTKCSDHTNPRDCSSQNSCAWCTSSKTCLNVNSNNGAICGGESCQGCLISTVINAPAGTLSCSDFQNPRECSSQPRCGWCSSTNSCTDVNGNGYICPPGVCQGCLNSNPLNAPAGNTFCSNYTDCRTCSTQPRCGWCTGSGCLDVDGNGYLCAPGQCNGCVRSNPINCPISTTKCSDHTNCRQCSLQNSCAWCTSSKTCVNVNSNNGYICDSDQCIGCIRGEVQQCPSGTSDCEDYTECSSCLSQSRCGWCGLTGQCLPINNYNNYLCAPNTCSSCFKTGDTSQCSIPCSSRLSIFDQQ